MKITDGDVIKTISGLEGPVIKVNTSKDGLVDYLINVDGAPIKVRLTDISEVNGAPFSLKSSKLDALVSKKQKYEDTANKDQFNYFHEFIKNHGLKQIEAARLLSTNTQTFEGYLHGTRTAPVSILEEVKFLDRIPSDEFEARLMLANTGRANDELARKRKEQREKEYRNKVLSQRSRTLKETLLNYVLDNDELSPEVVGFMKQQIKEAEDIEK